MNLFEAEKMSPAKRILLATALACLCIGGLYLALNDERNSKTNVNIASAIESKCPNDYTTAEEYSDSLGRFVGFYREQYPEMTADEIMLKRTEWMKLHNCSLNDKFPIDRSEGRPHAEDLNSEGKYKEALEIISEYLTDFPSDPGGYVIKGVALFGLDQCDSAMSNFEHALEIAPEKNDILQGLLEETLKQVGNIFNGALSREDCVDTKLVDLH